MCAGFDYLSNINNLNIMAQLFGIALAVLFWIWLFKLIFKSKKKD